MTLPASWLTDHLAGAPADLRRRIVAYACEAGAASPSPQSLAEASSAALTAALARPPTRAAALDLLAADALLTLALLAQAEQAPDGLGAFATRLITVDSASA